ncbi:hypothetical protein M011DRAFT_461703 [Sporormia fimetaria CBS 119925]|uniref:Uncharacterized protein n=1 Tax=Sporormia fimetaria CBS 119925 TaxID=1340428 RepID=A0A6A6V181_9PLEO|nr:hypothetical protein M011DRAFT_461703 [Sporormia fimetaria CBS 119925]
MATGLVFFVIQSVAATQPAAAQQQVERFTPYWATGNATIDTGVSPLLGLLAERQVCNQGFGYCSSKFAAQRRREGPRDKLLISSDNGGCCPVGPNCCPWGCLDPGVLAVRVRFVLRDLHVATGNQCCRGGGSCEAGNNCYWDGFQGQGVCCTNNECTAWVLDGKTTSGEVLTQVPTLTVAPTRNEVPTTVTEVAATVTEVVAVARAWTYTVTWSYRSYFWTYDYFITGYLEERSGNDDAYGGGDGDGGGAFGVYRSYSDAGFFDSGGGD